MKTVFTILRLMLSKKGRAKLAKMLALIESLDELVKTGEVSEFVRATGIIYKDESPEAKNGVV